MTSRAAGSSSADTSTGARYWPCASRSYRCRCLPLNVVDAAELVRRCRPASSLAPRQCPSVLSMSSINASGSRAGRSNLLTNVRIGSRWRRHTSNSFRVCDLDAVRRVDHHHHAVGGDERPICVFAEILVARGIESDIRRPSSSNSSAADVIEMPRCCSSSIQSDVAALRSLRPRTAPASSIAPAYSSSFSVSVVLPASGCEMMANVRRRATSRSSSL